VPPCELIDPRTESDALYDTADHNVASGHGHVCFLDAST
jgi:hypothetical protein